MITADELMTKARRALASSRLLLAAEDSGGACNRAYYAMYDASRAALIKAGYEELAITTKTHGGLISAFSLHLVKSGSLPIELGRSLNKVEDIRLMADYLGKEIELERQIGHCNRLSYLLRQLIKRYFLSDNWGGKGDKGP
ncbi:MAG: HEPN domain-containing protein [Gammaproteobacteria bacterium]|nr:HEPN domain-containing protein [Gammaproteobacteria bacterium]